jgi:hypothetical protein
VHALRKPETVPADVPAAALTLLEKGEAAAARSLLYRAAIAGVARRGAAAQTASWTEGDWLAFAERRAGREDARFLRELVGAWQSVAYAHRVPAQDAVRALCTRFPSHFGAA